VPEDWGDKPASDARRILTRAGRKAGARALATKHVNVDRTHNLVRRYHVTVLLCITARRHYLLNAGNPSGVWQISAYRSEDGSQAAARRKAQSAHSPQGQIGASRCRQAKGSNRIAKNPP